MRDIIKDYGKSETEKKERGVLDEYAEMCRYQNERQRKNNEDFSDEDLTVDEQEDIDSGKEQNLKRENTQNEQIKEMGQVVLDSNSRKHKVELLTIIGEVEGHESAPSHSKTTKYEYTLSLHDALPISEERRVGKECMQSLQGMVGYSIIKSAVSYRY